MAGKKRSSRKKDTILWIRVPKQLSMQKLKKLGLEETRCYGGDTPPGRGGHCSGDDSIASTWDHCQRYCKRSEQPWCQA